MSRWDHMLSFRHFQYSVLSQTCVFNSMGVKIKMENPPKYLLKIREMFRMVGVCKLHSRWQSFTSLLRRKYDRKAKKPMKELILLYLILKKDL